MYNFVNFPAGSFFVSCRRSYLRLYRIHFRQAPEKSQVDLRSVIILQKNRKPPANHGEGVNFSCMVKIKGNWDFLLKTFLMMTCMTVVDHRKPT